MSFSEMKVSSVFPDCMAFLLASRTASFLLADEPPPFSAARVAASILKSLSSAKSAGVRI